MKIKLAFVLLLLATSAPSEQQEQQSPPRWMADVTTAEPGKFKELQPCELDYQLSWNGILKAGEATLQLGLREPDREGVLIGKCKGKSSGLAKQFWYYKNSFESKTLATSLRPESYLCQETEKKEQIITQAEFGGGVVKSRETVRKRSGGATKTKERIFAYDHSHDMLSAVLYLRSLPLNEGDEITMVVHPFKSAYLTKFRVLGREIFNSPLGKTKAIKLEIKLHKIDKDLELKSYEKFKSAKIWISDDSYRLPLEVRSEVFIGSVRATLNQRKLLN